MIKQELWGTIDGGDIFLFTLTNKKGNYVQHTNYGARIVSIVVPDKHGHKENVVLGFSYLDGYLRDECYMGATLGRFANRIAGASFKIDDHQYLLEANEKGNSNHSGASSISKRVYDFTIEDNTLSFSLLSKDGEGGFPGNLFLHVSYTWTDENELLIKYKAVSDKRTIINLSNHSYFNLSADNENIFDHELNIRADKIIETDPHYIPTGRIINAQEKKIENHCIRDKLVLKENVLTGLNDCYVIESNDSKAICEVWEKKSGRSLKVYTSYPGILFYTGDHLISTVPGHLGRTYQPFDGFSLECQYFPDSPNHENFPSTILNVDEEYNEFIKFSFGLM